MLEWYKFDEINAKVVLRLRFYEENYHEISQADR